jgi:hypothetical protein
MRKTILLVVAILCLGLAAAGPAAAQASPVIQDLVIQIWPEYDQPAALVIYDFRVAQESLPATIKIRVPQNGDIFAVAKSTSQGLMNEPYEPPVLEGEYDVLTLNISEAVFYRVEYYAPLERNGIMRLYRLNWPGDYAVGTLQVLVQKAVGARNLQTLPALSELPGPDGFIYAQGEFKDLPAGEAFNLTLQYEKDDERLSAADQPPAAMPGIEQAQGSTMSLTQALPYLAGGLGLILVVGSLFLYWQSGRNRQARREAPRKRHTVATRQPDGQVYCSQCGKRAADSDRFCRDCGARLRRD